MKRYMKRISLAVCMALGLSQWAAGQVLEQLPQESVVVIKINHLNDTNKKIGDFIKATGLEGKAPPEMSDPIAALKQKVGVEKGLDLTRDAAVVLINPKIAADGKDESLVVVPVKSYAEFTANFADAKEEGDVTSFTGKDGKTVYAMKRGTYAAVSDHKEVLMLKPGGLKAPAMASKELEAKDIVAYANFSVIREDLLKSIETARTDAMKSMDEKAGDDNGMGDQPQPTNRRRPMRAGPPMPLKGPIGKAVVNRVFDTAATFIKESDGATIGLSLTDGGLNFCVQSEFQPTSYIGTMLGKFAGTDASLLKGLPDGNYILYGGLTADGAALAQVVDDFIKPIEVEVAKDAEAKKLMPLLDAYRAIIKSVKGGAFAMIAPSGALGQSPLIQVVGVTHGDVAALKKASHEALGNQEAVSGIMGAGMPKMKFEVTENAKTIDGVSFEQIVGSVAPSDNPTPEEMQMQQMMNFMYGPTGFTQINGQLDANTVVSATGVDDAVVSSLIASAKGGTDALAAKANVGETKKELPAKKIAEFYFAVDTLAKTALNYAAMFGMGMQINIPDDLPPIGFALATSGPSMQADMHVSTKLVKAVVDAIEQGKQQMGGGGGPGGPAQRRPRQRPRPGGADGL